MYEHAQRLIQVAVVEYRQHCDVVPEWWSDVAGEEIVADIFDGDDPREEFYEAWESLRTRYPEASRLLLKIESAACTWSQEWSDVAFLIGQAVGKTKTEPAN